MQFAPVKGQHPVRDGAQGRDLLVRQRSQTINAFRAHLAS
jgi:hypothetical protein